MSLCRLRSAFLVHNNRLARVSFSSKPYDSSSAATVLDGQGNIVCLHPYKRKHPYEHSKPLPVSEGSSFKFRSDKLQEDRQKDYLLSRKVGSGTPADLELQNMFYTDKYIWNRKPTYDRINRTLQKNVPKTRRGL